MLILLNILLFNALLAKICSGRHITPLNSYQSYTRPEFYNPLYSQSYAQPYEHRHSPSLYTPAGTYYDQRRGILRPFPGGGVPVLVDYHKRCSNQFVGLKPDPQDQQYYYVCKPDCVIFGKCQNLQIFNSTSGQCVQHPPPEYIPTCTKVGRFPLFSDCHIYYKCDKDLQAKIYTCPPYMIFSPISQKCINGNKCTPTQISARSSYMPEYCANKFPPCYDTGVFRSPTDCSLYYSCEHQDNGMYLQTRLRCPHGQFYDLQKNKCLPAEEVPCDCIQIAELVYPKPHDLAYHPKVYPAQFNLDSMEDNSYPIELSNEELTSESLTSSCYNNSESDSDSESQSLCESAAEEVTDNPTTASSIVNNTTVEQPLKETNFTFEHFQFGDDLSAEEEESSASFRPKEIFPTETSATFAIDNESTTQEIITDPTITISERTTNAPEENTTNVEDLSTFSKEFSAIHEESTTLMLEITSENTSTTTTSTTVLPTPVKTPSSPPSISCFEINEIHKEDDQTVPSAETQTKICKPIAITLSQDTTNQATVTTLDSELTRDSRSALVKQNKTADILTPTTLSTQVTNATTLEVDQHKHVKVNINNLLPSDTKQMSGNIKFQVIEPPTTETPSDESSITADISPALTISTSTPWKLDGTRVNENEIDFLENEIKLNDLEQSIETNNESKANKVLLDEEDFGNSNKDNNIINPSFLSAEGFLPVHIKTMHIDDRSEQTTDFDYITGNPREDFTTDINVDYDSDANSTATTIQQFVVMKTVRGQTLGPETITNSINISAKEEEKSNTVLKRRKTSEIEPSTDTSVIFRNSETSTFSELTSSRVISPQPEISTALENSTNTEVTKVPETSTVRNIARVKSIITFPQISKVPEKSIISEISTISDSSTIQASDRSTAAENSTVTNVTVVSKISTVPKVFKVPRSFTFLGKSTVANISTFPETSENSKLSTISAVPEMSTIPEIPSVIKFSETLETNTVPTITTVPEVTTVPENFTVEEISTILPPEKVSHLENLTAISVVNSISAEIPNANITPLHDTNATTLTPTLTTTCLTNFLDLKVREEQSQDNHDCHKRKLFYEFKTQPVITKTTATTSINNNINKTVAETACLQANNSINIPRLEIIAESPVDVHFRLCPSNCNKQHHHNFPGSSNRAVFVKWFANKSNQTMGFETTNDVETLDKEY